MGNKDQLAELVANLPEWQAGHLLRMTQAYLAAVREAEEKGRVDVSGEVIQFLNANTAIPQEKEAPKTAEGPQAAATPQGTENPIAVAATVNPQPAAAPRETAAREPAPGAPRGVAVWQAASYDRTTQGPNLNQSVGRVVSSGQPMADREDSKA